MTNSRAKGKRGELEFAAAMREHGFTARRGVQYDGSKGNPDVIIEELPQVHFEVKRYGEKKFTRKVLEDAVAQATRDARPGEVWAVVYREDGNTTWRVIMELPAWVEVMKRG